MKTKIGLASNHGGYEIKQVLKQRLEEQNFEVLDFGNHQFDANDDYPDFVIPLANAFLNAGFSNAERDKRRLQKIEPPNSVYY